MRLTAGWRFLGRYRQGIGSAAGEPTPERGPRDAELTGDRACAHAAGLELPRPFALAVPGQRLVQRDADSRFLLAPDRRSHPRADRDEPEVPGSGLLVHA